MFENAWLELGKIYAEENELIEEDLSEEVDTEKPKTLGE